MELVKGVATAIVSYGPPFLFVLTLVVFFHELGHFLVARWCGVAVKAFSIGFGPELVGWNDRHGTRWRIALLPLGGYVKFEGDEDAASTPDRDAIAGMTEEERARSFVGKSVGQRAAVVAAGPIANFILAIVIFASLFAIVGRGVIVPRVGDVSPGSAAEAAGIKKGDMVVSIDGTAIESFDGIMRIVSVRAGEPTAVTIARDGKTIDLMVTPQLVTEKSRLGVTRRGLLGIRASEDPADRSVRHYAPHQAVIEAVKETWFVVERTGGYIAGIFAGRESADQLGGPLRVAQISGEVAEGGFTPLISLAALLSVSIGLLNLMPVPMLDGGHLLFYAIEAARGRPLSERSQDVGFRIGMALVLMLVVFATWNDVVHLRSLWPA